MTPGDLVWIEAQTPLYKVNPVEYRNSISDNLITTTGKCCALSLVIHEFSYDKIIYVVVSGARRYVNRVWVLETIEVEQQIYT